LLYKKLANVLDQLSPVGLVARAPNIMVVTPSLPVKTVKEFIDYAKANPGQISFASSGVGAPRRTSPANISSSWPRSTWSMCPIAARPRPIPI
jgi:tripartite-type tricarboxylate transporter receptor subunit TctC